MAMTKADKQEMTEVFNDALKNFKQIEILERELISQKLDRIEKKIDYTNGTVKEHTADILALKKDLPHTSDSCPNKEIIKTLSEAHTSNKAVKNWAFTALGILLGVAGGVIATLEFILKHK